MNVLDVNFSSGAAIPWGTIECRCGRIFKARIRRGWREHIKGCGKCR